MICFLVETVVRLSLTVKRCHVKQIPFSQELVYQLGMCSFCRTSVIFPSSYSSCTREAAQITLNDFSDLYKNRKDGGWSCYSSVHCCYLEGATLVEQRVDLKRPWSPEWETRRLMRRNRGVKFSSDSWGTCQRRWRSGGQSRCYPRKGFGWVGDGKIRAGAELNLFDSK